MSQAKQQLQSSNTNALKLNLNFAAKPNKYELDSSNYIDPVDRSQINRIQKNLHAIFEMILDYREAQFKKFPKAETLAQFKPLIELMQKAYDSIDDLNDPKFNIELLQRLELSLIEASREYDLKISFPKLAQHVWLLRHEALRLAEEIYQSLNRCKSESMSQYKAIKTVKPEYQSLVKALDKAINALPCKEFKLIDKAAFIELEEAIAAIHNQSDATIGMLQNVLAKVKKLLPESERDFTKANEHNHTASESSSVTLTDSISESQSIASESIRHSDSVTMSKPALLIANLKPLNAEQFAYAGQVRRTMPRKSSFVEFDEPKISSTNAENFLNQALEALHVRNKVLEQQSNRGTWFFSKKTTQDKLQAVSKAIIVLSDIIKNGAERDKLIAAESFISSIQKSAERPKFDKSKDIVTQYDEICTVLNQQRNIFWHSSKPTRTMSALIMLAKNVETPAVPVVLTAPSR